MCSFSVRSNQVKSETQNTETYVISSVTSCALLETSTYGGICFSFECGAVPQAACTAALVVAAACVALVATTACVALVLRGPSA